jgi:hypothetical protein
MILTLRQRVRLQKPKESPASAASAPDQGLADSGLIMSFKRSASSTTKRSKDDDDDVYSSVETREPRNNEIIVDVPISFDDEIFSGFKDASIGDSNDPFHFFSSDEKLTDEDCDFKLSRIFGGVAKAMEKAGDIDGSNRIRGGAAHTATPNNDRAYIKLTGENGKSYMARNPDAGGVIHTYTDERASPRKDTALTAPGGWKSAVTYLSGSKTSGDRNSGIILNYGEYVIEFVHAGTNNENGTPSAPINPGKEKVGVIGFVGGQGGTSNVFDKKNGTISYNHTHIVFFSDKAKNLRIDPRKLFCGW